MIKNILIPQDGSDYSSAALLYGLWLAKRFRARLRGLHVVDIVSLEGPFIRDISGSMGVEPYLNFSAKMREVLEARGAEILASFTESCGREGVECVEESAFGIVANEICEKARTADLIVMGRHGVNEMYEHGLLGSITEAVVRKSQRPVFVTPKAFKEPGKPLLAYDGSPGAAKAMHSAAEFVKELGLPLTVISVSTPGSGADLIHDAKNYLKPYALSVHYEQIPAPSGEAPTVIDKYYKENGHDLLFMGATHHSRLMELVLGSTAEHLMRAAAGPLFIER